MIDESVSIFFKENNIYPNKIIKSISKLICVFPRSRQSYNNEDLLRIVYVDNLKLLYYIDDDTNTIFIIECTFKNSNVKLKVRN